MPLACKHWAKSGIKIINVIIENSILKERNIYNNLVFKAGFNFEMFTLKSCIPNEWMDKAVDLDMSFNQTMEQSILDAMFRLPNDKQKKLGELSSKEIYNILLLNNKTMISSKSYWLKKFPQHNIVREKCFSYINLVNKLLPRKCRLQLEKTYFLV